MKSLARFAIIPHIFVMLISFASFFLSCSVSYFRVHFFHWFFVLFWYIASSAVSFLVAVVIMFSRRGHHTNLVSFVIFPSFLLALVVFLFCFCFLLCKFSLFVCVCFQRIASKNANPLDVWISITDSAAC